MTMQLLEYFVLKQFLARPQSRAWLAASLVCNLAMGLTFSWLSVPFWLTGDPLAAAVAVLLVASAIFSGLMSSEGSLAAFVSVVTPHIGYLLVLP